MIGIDPNRMTLTLLWPFAASGLSGLPSSSLEPTKRKQMEAAIGHRAEQWKHYLFIDVPDRQGRRDNRRLPLPYELLSFHEYLIRSTRG